MAKLNAEKLIKEYNNKHETKHQQLDLFLDKGTSTKDCAKVIVRISKLKTSGSRTKVLTDLFTKFNATYDGSVVNKLKEEIVTALGENNMSAKQRINVALEDAGCNNLNTNEPEESEEKEIEGLSVFKEKLQCNYESNSVESKLYELMKKKTYNDVPSRGTGQIAGCLLYVRENRDCFVNAIRMISEYLQKVVKYTHTEVMKKLYARDHYSYQYSVHLYKKQLRERLSLKYGFQYNDSDQFFGMFDRQTFTILSLEWEGARLWNTIHLTHKQHIDDIDFPDFLGDQIANDLFKDPEAVIESYVYLGNCLVDYCFTNNNFDKNMFKILNKSISKGCFDARISSVQGRLTSAYSEGCDRYLMSKLPDNLNDLKQQIGGNAPVRNAYIIAYDKGEVSGICYFDIGSKTIEKININEEKLLGCVEQLGIKEENEFNKPVKLGKKQLTYITSISGHSHSGSKLLNRSVNEVIQELYDDRLYGSGKNKQSDGSFVNMVFNKLNECAQNGTLLPERETDSIYNATNKTVNREGLVLYLKDVLGQINQTYDDAEEVALEIDNPGKGDCVLYSYSLVLLFWLQFEILLKNNYKFEEDELIKFLSDQTIEGNVKEVIISQIKAGEFDYKKINEDEDEAIKIVNECSIKKLCESYPDSKKEIVEKVKGINLLDKVVESYLRLHGNNEDVDADTMKVLIEDNIMKLNLENPEEKKETFDFWKDFVSDLTKETQANDLKQILDNFDKNVENAGNSFLADGLINDVLALIKHIATGTQQPGFEATDMYLDVEMHSNMNDFLNQEVHAITDISYESVENEDQLTKTVNGQNGICKIGQEKFLFQIAGESVSVRKQDVPEKIMTILENLDKRYNDLNKLDLKLEDSQEQKKILLREINELSNNNAMKLYIVAEYLSNQPKLQHKLMKFLLKDDPSIINKHLDRKLPGSKLVRAPQLGITVATNNQYNPSSGYAQLVNQGGVEEAGHCITMLNKIKLDKINSKRSRISDNNGTFAKMKHKCKEYFDRDEIHNIDQLFNKIVKLPDNNKMLKKMRRYLEKLQRAKSDFNEKAQEKKDEHGKNDSQSGEGRNSNQVKKEAPKQAKVVITDSTTDDFNMFVEQINDENNESQKKEKEVKHDNQVKKEAPKQTKFVITDSTTDAFNMFVEQINDENNESQKKEKEVKHD